MEIVAIIISLVLLVTDFCVIRSSRIRPSRVARVHGVIYG